LMLRQHAQASAALEDARGCARAGNERSRPTERRKS
jgi:hypothetical protein